MVKLLYIVIWIILLLFVYGIYWTVLNESIIIWVNYVFYFVKYLPIEARRLILYIIIWFMIKWAIRWFKNSETEVTT